MFSRSSFFRIFVVILCFWEFPLNLLYAQSKLNLDISEIERAALRKLQNSQYDSAAMQYLFVARYHENEKEWLKSVENYRLAAASLLGNSYVDSAQYVLEIAGNIFEKRPLKHSKKIHQEKIKYLIELGNVYEYKELFQDQLAKYQEALDLIGKDNLMDSLLYINVLNKNGLAFLNCGDFVQANYYCKKALKIHLKLSGNNPVQLAENYTSMGLIKYNENNYDSSLYYFQESNKILKNNQTELLVAENYENIAYIFGLGGNFDEGLGNLEKALEIRLGKLNPKHLKIADIYSAKAKMLLQKAEYTAAQQLFNDALQIYLKKLGENSSLVADAYSHLGGTYDLQGEFDVAEKYYKKSLEINILIHGDQHLSVARSYIFLSNISLMRGEYKKALKQNEMARDIYLSKSGEDKRMVAIIYANIGLAYYMLNDFDKALENYIGAAKLYVSSLGESTIPVSMIYRDIALLYFSLKDYEKAMDYQKKAIKIKIEILGENHPENVEDYSSVGQLYTTLGNYDLALQYLDKAARIILDNHGDQNISLAAVYNIEANIYSQLEMYDSAIYCYKSAIKINNKVFNPQHPDVGFGYYGLGNIYKAKKDYEKSKDFYLKALTVQLNTFGSKHGTIAETYNKIGDLMFEKDSCDQALLYYQKALISNVRYFNDTLLGSNPVLNDIYSKNALLETLANKANCLFQRFKILKDTTELLNAVNTYKRTIDLIGELRNDYSTESTKLILGEESKAYFTRAILASCIYHQLSNSSDKKSPLFEIMEQSKGNVLAAKLHELNTGDISEIPKEILEKDLKIKNGLSFYATKLDQSKTLGEEEKVSTLEEYQESYFQFIRQYDSLQMFYKQEYPRYYMLKYNTEIADLGEIQQKLSGNTALIDYYISDTLLFIVCITDSSVYEYHLDLQPAFHQDVMDYYVALRNLDINEYNRLKPILYSTLVAPVISQLTNIENLIIIPDDYLFYVPFETLGQDDQKNGNVVRYLIEKYSITYHQSATVWCESFDMGKKRVSFSPQLSFVGYAPVFDNNSDNGTISESNRSIFGNHDPKGFYRSISVNGKNFQALPFSKAEVDTIASLFREKNLMAKTCTNRQAKEKNFKSDCGIFRIVHVASHAFSNDEYPRLSGLAFSQPDTNLQISEDNDDGVLYTGELYHLKMNSDLVVLSACETGIGKLVKGEGLLSLSRGFLYAGTPNVIYSLWRIPDRATKELMVAFYRHILEGKSYSKSLQQAKLDMLNNDNYAFPLYWGGIVLVGE